VPRTGKNICASVNYSWKAAFPHIRDAYERGIPDEMQGVRKDAFTDEFVEEVSGKGRQIT